MRRTATYLLVVSVTILTVEGIVMLYSTTVAVFGEALLKRQLLWCFIGIVAAVIGNYVDYRRFSRWVPCILAAVSLPLLYLAAVHLASRVGVPHELLGKLPLISGRATKGAFRWLTLGPIRVQPSEFAKLALICFLARYYSVNARYLQTFKRGVLIPSAVAGTLCIAILLSGSLSITGITGLVVMAMLFVAGVQLRYFIAGIAVALTVVAAVLTTSPERMSRVTTFRHPEKYRAGECYQLYHSQLALGTGGWRGVGFNQSRMKEYYLPEAHNDFIMAIIGEELGFVATAGTILLYLLLVAACFGISVTAADREGMLLAFGIGTSIGLNAFINIGVVSGFLPTTGITAPLISYGGSSMLATWASIGIVAGVSRVARKNPESPRAPAERSVALLGASVGIPAKGGQRHGPAASAH